MGPAEWLVLVGAAVVVLFGARGGPRHAEAVVMLVLLGIGAALGILRARPRPSPTPRERYAAAAHAQNPYEALFAARLWAEHDDVGAITYAREAAAFGLYRTCQTQAARLVDASDTRIRDEARVLATRCGERPAGEGP